MVSSRGRKQPLNFRKEEVKYVMQRWRASESCSLIGVGSVGKSNLLQHLANPDVHAEFLSNVVQPGYFKTILIDPNLLTPLPHDEADIALKGSWAGYELMMHRLFMSFYPFDEIIGPEDGQQFYQLYQQLGNGLNPLYAHMGLRYFELALDILMRNGIRLVFMFDEFEEMLKKMPENFFQTLRGLRDANKRHLSYLTFTRKPLLTLADQFEKNGAEMEPFIELFTDNVKYVGPYNPIDARQMVERLASRNNKNYSKEQVDFLLWATGGYAGLIRSGFRVLEAISGIDQTSVMDDNIASQLANRRPIRTECHTIWMSLTPPEHHVLKATVGLHNYDSNAETEEAVGMLVQKRLLYVDKIDDNMLRIQPPVFKSFVQTNPDNETY